MIKRAIVLKNTRYIYNVKGKTIILAQYEYIQVSVQLTRIFRKAAKGTTLRRYAMIWANVSEIKE